MFASSEELLQTAKWRRALAVKARELFLEITNEAARGSLLLYAADLDPQSDQPEAQAAALGYT